ncbi:MAG: hypothetical protein ISS93_01035 [Candidatus Aenigmarchaeota archaeon]|nr:hypothetical protein [Candidatus Aenigmarchaeota archaeon]
MGKKYYLILGIIVLVVIAGVWVGVDFSQTETILAMSPYIEFEATVVSLSLGESTLDDLAIDQSKSYVEGEELYNAPSDSAVVKVDRVIETGGTSNFDWSSIGVEEGKEVSLDFSNTVRPTKIITAVGETTQSGSGVSHQIVHTRISFEDGYFVFRVNGNSVTETILPGLKEGSKFRTKLWRIFGVEVGEYEIIS